MNTLQSMLAVVSVSAVVGLLASCDSESSTGNDTKTPEKTAPIAKVDTVVAPAFSPVAGTYTGTQFLVLSSVTNDAEIFYTTNGAVPTSASTKYTAPIKLMASQTIKAIALKTGMATSAVDSASYTIKPGATSTGSLILGNQTYRTVKIDEQNWMAENLNFRGSGADTVGVCYRDSVGYCTKNGRLYTWAEVMNLPDSCSVVSCASQIKPKHQGICPTGWHVPTKAEWTSLTDFTGSEGISSLPLRTETGWKDMRDGTDIYGFSVLPAGARYPTGEYECNGNYAFFWSATEQSPKEAWRRYFSYGYEYGCSYFFEKTYGRSLRCVED